MTRNEISDGIGRSMNAIAGFILMYLPDHQVAAATSDRSFLF